MKRSILISLSIALVAMGCYPAGPEFVEDVDVVYTNFDDEYNFQSKGTYAMPDKIVVDVEIELGDTTYVYMKDAFAEPILEAIDDRMAAYGWEKVNPEVETPDIVISPAAIKSTTYFFSYWYDWWYGWGGWYGGYWGWYYPPYWSVSSITTGSMVLVMADPSEAGNSPIDRSPVVWTMVGNGLFTGAYDISRVNNAIDQAFDQSPYLKLN